MTHAPALPERPAATDPDLPGGRVTSDRMVTVVLASSGLTAAFMQTVVTPIIPELPALLHSSTSDATWVLTATLLAAAVAAPITGRLGDMFGKRRIALALLFLMLLGSIVCATSDSIVPMIAGRALQGLGIGVVPLGISILRDAVRPQSLGRSVALVSATLGVGGAIGLPAAAWIAQSFDYHYLFVFSAALTLAAIILVWIFIPASIFRSGGRFDFLGAIGFGIGIVGVLLALSKSSTWGWTSPAVLALLLGGAVVLVVWGIVELRTHAPLVDLRLAACRPVLLTNLGSATIGFAFFTMTSAGPVILESPSG